MKSIHEAKIHNLLRGIEKARELRENRELARCRDLLEELQASARKLGIDSAHLHWELAITCDYQGDTGALEHVRQALALDPLSVNFRRSYEIIVGRIRESLLSVDGDKSGKPGLYRLLIASGAADTACHLAMARLLLENGDREGAEQILDALAIVAPSSAELWELRAELAATAGDSAAEAEARCRALGAADGALRSLPVARG